MQLEGIDFELIWRKLNASLTSREEQYLERWINQDPRHEEYFHKVLYYYKENKVVNAKQIDSNVAWKVLEGKLKNPSQKKTYRLSRVASVAAVFLIAAVLGVFLIFNDLDEKSFADRVDIQIPPGKSLAILKTGNNKEIKLIEGTSFIDTMGGAKVLNSNLELVYSAAKLEDQLVPEIHNLEIPRGGKYFLVLQDSTKVWLNSETKITYPSIFLPGEERIVELEGEAYFQVAKDINRPFKVKINNQLVEVLGTTFNISSYDDDEYQCVTLVEGKVKVETSTVSSESFYLEPGTQLSYSQLKHTTTKTTVDVNYYISWVNDSYLFKNKSLENIMKTFSRWYDIDVVFKDFGKKNILFTGEIDRVQNFENVLEVIEKTNEVKFKLVNGQIIIY